MRFVDFDICHRMASLQKLYSVTLTYIFDLKCLKYMNFVNFCMLRASKIMKKFRNTYSNICDRTLQVSFFPSMTLTFIRHFKCLKYVKFPYSILPETWNYEKKLITKIFHPLVWQLFSSCTCWNGSSPRCITSIVKLFIFIRIPVWF